MLLYCLVGLVALAVPPLGVQGHSADRMTFVETGQLPDGSLVHVLNFGLEKFLTIGKSRVLLDVTDLVCNRVAEGKDFQEVHIGRPFTLRHEVNLTRHFKLNISLINNLGGSFN